MTEPLGHRIRRLRETRGLSQNDLARAADVSPNQVYLIESGKRQSLRPDTLERYARALGEDEAYLLTGVRGEQSMDETEQPLDIVLRRTSTLSEEDIQAVKKFVRFLESQSRLERVTSGEQGEGRESDAGPSGM